MAEESTTFLSQPSFSFSYIPFAFFYAQSKEQIVHEIKGVPEEYLPNRLQVVRLFRESIALKPAEASFRKGWEGSISR